MQHAESDARAHAPTVPSVFTMRPMQHSDNDAIAQIIRAVMTEFGASGEGYSINDPEVDDMFTSYDQPRSAYFVLVSGDRVVGGGGVAQLEGAESDVCELRKMYFLTEARGSGAGRRMLDLCLEIARTLGYQRCYLETLSTMTRAAELYARSGFERISAPMGRTGHFKCDAWYVRTL